MSASSKSWQEGVVHWFDEKSGEGMIKGSDGRLYFVHHSAIEQLTEARRAKQVALKDKQRVRYQLLEDVTFAQVSRVREI